MQSAGQPQVFATQYYKDANDPYALKQPMKADMISDSIRQIFNVPTFEESKKRLLELNGDASLKSRSSRARSTL